MSYGEIYEGEVFPKNEFFEVKAKAEELYKEVIAIREQRKENVRQIREAVYTIIDLVSTFSLYGEAIKKIRFESFGEGIRIGVWVFRQNIESNYYSSFEGNDLSEVIKKAEEKINEGKCFLGNEIDLRRFINRFDGWNAYFEQVTGDNSFTISFED